jgi:hypothetical protein
MPSPPHISWLKDTGQTLTTAAHIPASLEARLVPQDQNITQCCDVADSMDFRKAWISGYFVWVSSRICRLEVTNLRVKAVLPEKRVLRPKCLRFVV